MKTKLFLPILALVCAASVICWVRFARGPERAQNQVWLNQTSPPPLIISSLAPSVVPPDTNSANRIASAAESLKNNNDPVGSAKNLGELRNHLNSLGANTASSTVRQWLDSGEDAATRLEFKLSPDGSLKTAPTLRTFLLDYLAQIDSKAAAAYAEKILSSQNSADEWAVALRAYARGNSSPDAQTFLQKKIREMLGNRDWRDNPSVGFLEAFDVIVHTRDRELTPELGNMIQQKDNRALGHAAYLTLDRLVQAAPADVLGQLQTQPELMEGHERTRADFFARADMRDPAQRALLENYLLDSKRSGSELQQFAGIFPNANYMVSYNLLTQTVTPTGAELALRDREALNTVQQWLDDPRFEKLKPQLQTIKSRLEQFVKQADENQP